MTSVYANHNKSCENAVRHECRCTGCGGSLHGWPDWLGLAYESDDQRWQDRWREVDARGKMPDRRPRRGFGRPIRAAVTDLARLDIVGWLVRNEIDVPIQRTVGRMSESSNEGERVPHNVIIGAGVYGQSDNRPNTLLSDSPEPPESQLLQVETGSELANQDLTESHSKRSKAGQADGANDGGSLLAAAKSGSGAKDLYGLSGPELERDHHGGESRPRPSPRQQVEAFARELTSIWPDIVAELNDLQHSKDIKRQLANHFWCDLFVGLVKVVEDYQGALKEIPESSKRWVKQAIRDSTKRLQRPDVTGVVVDIVVDKVWQAFKGAMFTQFPLLEILDKKEVLRSLRILAVFACPAPEDHVEVREHALKPLGDDARAILTAETKNRLAKCFREWVNGGDGEALTESVAITS